jgi:putative DNA methylase
VTHTTAQISPFSLKDTPALIERLLPVQKLSVEAYKEQMAVHGKTLTALGSYWKGRKPLILNKACILGCLLPATDEPARDLELFEKLMAMDDESFVARWKRRPRPKEILAKLSIACIEDFFVVDPPGALPSSSPVDWSNPAYEDVKVNWRHEFVDADEIERRKGNSPLLSLIPHPSSLMTRRQIEAQLLPDLSYRDRVDQAYRPEEVMGSVHDHIWDEVNAHLGTSARSFPELTKQLGIMRFGQRPRVADTFCGSGQIPFEAARLGCDVYASDLNPIACMLTWGALNIVGGSPESREQLARDQQALVRRVQEQIDALGVETDGQGWRAKVFLYCVETTCPQTGWSVPLLPSRVISKGYRVIAELVPDPVNKRYDIQIRGGITDRELKAAESGTVGRDSKYEEAYLIHQVEGTTYKTKISTLRGDYRKPDGSIGNRLRLWDKRDFMPRPDDLLQERLYCIQWMRPKKKGKSYDYEFRAVTPEDLARERLVEAFIAEHIAEWQEKGWIPDMRIEVGGPPRYQALDLVKARGWTFWQHAFNARQLLIAGLLRSNISAITATLFAQSLNWNSKLSHWNNAVGGGGGVAQTFYNQAISTLYNYGTRSSEGMKNQVLAELKSFPLPASQKEITVKAATVLNQTAEIYITDPPYGDAVKYEEILDFFIAWLRKNPPAEFADWTWDSRRSLAIQGEGEDFRRQMVAAYKRMAECMPDNGIQVVMFTHQSEAIWADMANIVWASGLQVTAAWYVATETDSALRAGSHVKGTVLLVLRKRSGHHKTTRDDLAWELQEEVNAQVQALTGLNQQARGLYRDENVFEDADIQMAGHAAALRVLTHYAVIDGKDMAAESLRPRVKGETTFVDGLIAFAVAAANQCLVPAGISRGIWERLTSAERFYLKMLELEARGMRTLDNYQNFAKAFKVRDFHVLMANRKANAARLKGAVDLGRAEMGEGSELYGSTLRAVLYALMELAKNLDGDEVLRHLALNTPDWYADSSQRDLAAELAGYLVQQLETLRPDEASAARVLRELVRNQRVG